MNLNIHHVKSTLGASLLLAGPGAVFGTFSLAALVKYCLPYDWPWSLCFVFGSILCATDPVLLHKYTSITRILPTYSLILMTLIGRSSCITQKDWRINSLDLSYNR